MASDSAIQQSKNRGQISKHMESGSYCMFKPSFHMENGKSSSPVFPLVSVSSEHCLCSTGVKQTLKGPASPLVSYVGSSCKTVRPSKNRLVSLELSKSAEFKAQERHLSPQVHWESTEQVQ